MKFLTSDQLAPFFVSLRDTWEVRLPVRLPDGTRALGALDEGPPDLMGGPLSAKPTAAFFPQTDQLFTASGGEFRQPPSPDKPLLVVGLTASDLDCLTFIDRFFSDGFPDDHYFRRRNNALIIVVSGWCGSGGTFLKMAEGDCDLEMVKDEEGWLLLAGSEAGKAITASLSDHDDQARLERLRRTSARLANDNERLLQQAAELLRDDLVPDSFWAEIGDRCILCTGCNLVCPTCTCFGLQDWRSAERTERSRMWDSCQLDGFMREASGHNPLGSEGLRTRRRIHHKLAADVTRWGEISCFLCGRCDATCPTGIGIVAVAREMVERYGD